ncbi:hypothetical protein [Cyclobacterium marinum]|uniref:Outer membrane protein beta-barrel domain-containing protein n=1 Tax=Cyclobacterium marinum (strain ATCC 25205 / DSM 745 / LMG 13164 / NCIMB 1802) TaxID=880070 RepID=G0J0U7_CYCMS|nr:hypothetical protein [Cyclobacterium marinum]AEL25073.1 hypothetical protein Cycma_1302 [Cyclobacterium marinum DSM 745]MBI0401456.1 hypothetical protein [Cyclobacterium marinum]MBR9773626.1 hypothetical protein [Cytophagales bacterium]|tara:strand:+ start:59132 stop:59572 length:441 start_codon:yes stop_codon:yes gene_type:complete
MKIINCIVLIVGITILTTEQIKAQQAGGSFLVSTGVDLIRTDLNKILERAQFGAEVNYFYLHQLSFSGGYEYNINHPNQVTAGLRYYPLEPVFLRARALLGNGADFGLGAGYTYNLSYRMRLEGMTDYYVQRKAIGLRVGLAILIN